MCAWRITAAECGGGLTSHLSYIRYISVTAEKESGAREKSRPIRAAHRKKQRLITHRRRRRHRNNAARDYCFSESKRDARGGTLGALWEFSLQSAFVSFFV
jgi:hypothetical protein